MSSSHKEEILKELYFEKLYTTEIFDRLRARGISIGPGSLKRLRELQQEGVIRGVYIDGRKEKRWEKIRVDSKGQMGLL